MATRPLVECVEVWSLIIDGDDAYVFASEEEVTAFLRDDCLGFDNDGQLIIDASWEPNLLRLDSLRRVWAPMA